MSVLQESYSALEVALVFVQTAGLGGVSHSALQPENEPPTSQVTVDVLANVIEQFDKAQLRSHVSCIVVESGSVQKGMFPLQSLDTCVAIFNIINYVPKNLN